MSKKYSGSCLCGAVRFEISGEFDRFYLCHCGRCRKDSGSAHAANLFSSTAQLAWLSGADSAREYNLPETRHRRSFCGDCGSALPYQRPNGGGLVAPAGSLDSAIAIRPDGHIFMASKAGWDAGLQQVPTFDGFPVSRTVMDRVVVSQPYIAQFTDPIEFHKGEAIAVEEEDAEFPGWYWCTDMHGKQGWVHHSLLSATTGMATSLREYNARELMGTVGTTGEVVERLAGWLLLRVDDETIGWIPEKHTSPA